MQILCSYKIYSYQYISFELSLKVDKYLIDLFGYQMFNNTIPIKLLLNETGLLNLFNLKYVYFYTRKITSEVSTEEIRKLKEDNFFIKEYNSEDSVLGVNILLQDMILCNNIYDNANLSRLLNDDTWVVSVSNKLSDNLRNIYEERIKKTINIILNIKKSDNSKIKPIGFSEEFKKDYKEQLAKFKLLMEDKK